MTSTDLRGPNDPPTVPDAPALHSDAAADAPTLHDAAERKHAVYGNGSMIVTAPAGSGKTRLLTQRYLRLLGGVDSPERILALTFTNRAAAEMRARVAAALDAATADSQPETIDAESWQLARAALDRLAAEDLSAQEIALRLRIETIDSFNGWLTSQLPLAAGRLARLRITTNPERLYREAAERTIADGGASGRAEWLEHALDIFDHDASALAAVLARMLAAREQWLPVLAGDLEAARIGDESSARRVREQLDASLALLVQRPIATAARALGAERVSELHRLLCYAVTQLPEDSKHLRAWVDDASALRIDAGDRDRWRDLARVVLTNDGTVRVPRSANKTIGFPVNDALRPSMQALLEEIARDPGIAERLQFVCKLPHATYDDAQWANVRAFAAVLVLCAAEFDQLCRERGQCDFAAVSRAARAALGSPQEPTDLGLRLDYRLQHILFDEFQDTSHAQIELLELLTAGWQADDGRTVFCVGDPMQSIYGFRDADVRAFLDLPHRGLGNLRFELLHLRSNFRSRRSIVEWNNASFSRIFPARDDRDRGAIAFIPAVAVGTEGAMPAPIGLQEFAEAEAEAGWIAERIAEHRRDQPATHIAVLVRRRIDAAPIIRALRKNAIDFDAGGIETLGEHPAVRDVIALTRALTHRADSAAWCALLRSPVVGLVLADILLLVDSAATIWQAIRDPTTIARLSANGAARVRRLADILSAAFAGRADLAFARWIEDTWVALGGPFCVGSAAEFDLVRAAFERLAALDVEGLPDAAELDAAFEKLFARERPAAADGHRRCIPVEIMTIHRAKGLEFDVVFVAALQSAPRGGGNENLWMHTFERGEDAGVVLAVRLPTAEPDELCEFLKLLEADAARFEAARVLYVACTRPASALYLSAVTGFVPGKNDKAFTPLANSLLQILCASLPEPLAGLRQEGAVQPVRELRVLCRLPLDVSLRHGALIGESVVPENDHTLTEPPVFDWASETARQIGIWVHAQLQTRHLSSMTESQCAALYEPCRSWLTARCVPAERIDNAARRAIDALLGVRSDERGLWIFSGEHRDARREFALSTRRANGVTRVIFDRSFIDRDGQRWVIDYKTSAHTGGGLEAFLDNEVIRYRPQMQSYAACAALLGPEPVRLGLYFPLMRAWREWAHEAS